LPWPDLLSPGRPRSASTAPRRAPVAVASCTRSLMLRDRLAEVRRCLRVRESNPERRARDPISCSAMPDPARPRVFSIAHLEPAADLAGTHRAGSRLHRGRSSTTLSAADAPLSSGCRTDALGLHRQDNSVMPYGPPPRSFIVTARRRRRPGRIVIQFLVAADSPSDCAIADRGGLLRRRVAATSGSLTGSSRAAALRERTSHSCSALLSRNRQIGSHTRVV